MLLDIILLAVAIAAIIAAAKFWGDKQRLKALIPREREAADDHLRVVAAEAFARSGRELNAGQERQLQQLLEPLRRDIEQFRRRVDDCYSAEARERFALKEQVSRLIRDSAEVGRHARDLAGALRGNNRVQGLWGEMLLSSILEASGLREGHEFKTQVAVEGKRPDVIVYFPGDRCLVIDSKVSLTSYLDLCNAAADADIAALERAHADSVWRHVMELDLKRYQALVGESTLDFVVMFIPNEPAYIALMRSRPEIWERAMKRGVLIASPTHLVTVLRLAAELWRREAAEQNAKAIAQEAGRMLDKFIDFCADMTKMRNYLDRATNACDSAMNRLRDGRDSLVSRARRVRDMGVPAKADLPEPSDSYDTAPHGSFI